MSCTAVDVQNARLNYLTVGHGSPLIVVPGGPGFGYAYLRRPLTDQLAHHRQLTFYDPRGSGSSSGHETAADLTMETFVADLDEIRIAIDAETVDLLGHSFGGLLLLHYALRHPGRVRSLVLVDGDPATWEDWNYFRKVLDARRNEADVQRLQEIQSEEDWGHRPALVEEYFRVLLRPYFGARDYSYELRFGFDAASYEKLNITSEAVRRHLGEWDLTGLLSAIEVPALLVYGGKSIFRPGSAESMHAALPGSQLEIMPDVGHFPFLEDPVSFGSIVGAFLENQSG